MIRNGYTFTVNEMELHVNAMLRFPDIRENPYLKQSSIVVGLLLRVLDLELTEESVHVIHQVLKKY